MNISLFLVSVFSALGLVITHSALKPQGDDEETDTLGGILSKRLSRIETIMLADDTISKRLSHLEKEMKRVVEENNLLRDVVEKQESTLKQLAVDIKKLQSDNFKLGRLCKEEFVNIVSTGDDENFKQDLAQKHARTNHTTRDNWQMVKNNEGRIDEKYDDSSPTSQDTKTKNYLGNNGFIPHGHIRQTEVGQFAFYSTVSTDHITNLGVYHTIVFDRVITNIGGAYHPNIGVFITPVDGVYVFNLGAMSRERKWQDLQLIKDGSWIQSILPDAGTFDSSDTASLVAVLELNKGNEVWVRTGVGSGEIVGRSYTYFSGWLLFRK